MYYYKRNGVIFINNQLEEPVVVRRGDIFLIDLTDVNYINPHIISKTRPGLIIQNNVGNETSHNIIVALFTSSDKKPYPFQYKIDLDGKETTIMFDQIMTLPKSNLIRKIGELTKKQIFEADLALMCSIDISRYSIANISSFDIKSIVTTKTRTGEETILLFELVFYNDKRRESYEISILLDKITEFNPEITIDTDIDSIKSTIDCCAGLNFLLNHGEAI